MNDVEERKEVVPQAGASVTPYGVDYRVWAPGQPAMSVLIASGNERREIRLREEEQGYWAGFDSGGCAGDRYWIKRADGRRFPDVASRFQPEGVHGPSECIDPWAYRWQCDTWVRPGWTGQSIYEVHLGTLTEAGTYRAAIDVLDRVRELNIDAIEIMPLADFAGDRNWGYDGVAFYAPARCYGRPDELRALVDAAHERGLAVILDVVYNHVGPAGNYFGEYCRSYFRADKGTAWGQAFDLDGPRSRPVRDFLVGNAAYWLDEFRFDGLRLDAVHAIQDGSVRHLLAEIADAAHTRGAFLIAEDERNEARILRSPEPGGIRFDAAWADDFHHQVRVALTGTQESYFRCYSGRIEELASTLAHGWTYRGQSYPAWDGRARGTACAHLPANAFVLCIENHDQIGNRPDGARLEHLVSPREFRAASMLLCLSPYVPMIFMGQEWAASTPFFFFTDHQGDLGRQISAERRREFEKIGMPWDAAHVPDPESALTFARSKLCWEEREESGHTDIRELYRECLEQRKKHLHGSALQRDRWQVEQAGQFLGLRYRGDGRERMLMVALRPAVLESASLPTSLQASSGRFWQIVMHSEERRFGGDRDISASRGKWTLEGPGAVWLEAAGEGTCHAAQ